MLPGADTRRDWADDIGFETECYGGGIRQQNALVLRPDLAESRQSTKGAMCDCE